MAFDEQEQYQETYRRIIFVLVLLVAIVLHLLLSQLLGGDGETGHPVEVDFPAENVVQDLPFSVQETQEVGIHPANAYTGTHRLAEMKKRLEERRETTGDQSKAIQNKLKKRRRKMGEKSRRNENKSSDEEVQSRAVDNLGSGECCEATEVVDRNDLAVKGTENVPDGDGGQTSLPEEPQRDSQPSLDSAISNVPRDVDITLPPQETTDGQNPANGEQPQLASSSGGIHGQPGNTVKRKKKNRKNKQKKKQAVAKNPSSDKMTASDDPEASTEESDHDSITAFSPSDTGQKSNAATADTPKCENPNTPSS